MRKPTWLDLGIAVLGLFLVCSAARGVAQTQSTGMGAQSPSTEDTSIGDVTQDSRTTGTSDAMGSGSGLVTNDTPQETGTGGAGTTGTGTGGAGTTAGTGTGQTAGTAQGTGTGGSGTGTQGTAVDAAQQRLEVARLRTEVARLEQQLAQMRARLSQAESASQGTGGSGAGTGGSGAGTGGSGPGVGGSGAGTGGSGPTGIGDPSAEGPEVNTGVGDPAAEGVGRSQATQPDTSNQGYAVAHVIHTGRVRSVSQQRLVLVDEGGLVKTLTLAPNVRVVRGGRQVALQSLSEGAVVRASGDMYARDNPVFEIQVVPTAPAR